MKLQSKWRGNVISKLDIRMMKGAIKDVYFLAPLPISSELHFKAFMNVSVNLWKVIENMHPETLIDYVGGTDMYLVPLCISAIERQIIRYGGTIIEHFNNMQITLISKFEEVKHNYPNIGDEIEYYLEKEIDAISEHLDIKAIYNKLNKGGKDNAF